MQVIFLGGAGGIGASCVAVEMGGQWLLVDAGIRMNPHEDRLPDLAFLQDKSLAAIFVTHAHADHIGALPIVQQAFPAVPIYTSRATMLLMEVMLADALQIMAKRATDEMEVPLYDETAVKSTLHMLRPLPLTGKVTVPELRGITIYTARAGHVAGAMSLGFESPDGKLVISGDVSVTPQRTIPGADLIGLRHPDLMLLESTYGSRLHPNRQHEEDRLAQTVAARIGEGGHVLIPAFALGRAQEVLRILHEAQRRGRIPEFPVWVDGLVRTVCATYAAMPEALTPALERQVRKGYPPFFTGMIRSVTDPRQREKILDGPPACIVTSSGMLTGGPSAFFAARMADKPDNAILITGYQDEESPGRKLLNLADAGSGTLEIGGTTVQVRCHFDRYSLSAHADGSELAGMVGALSPRQVALVHGDGAARAELGQRLERLTKVLLPEDGRHLEISGGGRPEGRGSRHKRPRRKPAATAPATLANIGASEGRPLNAATLRNLWEVVSDRSGEQILSLRELALAWFGSTAGADEEALVGRVLATNQQFFVPHPDLPEMMRVLSPGEVHTDTTRPADQALQPPPPPRAGMLALLRGYNDKLIPLLLTDVRSEMVRAYLPDSEGQRTRFPRSALLEVIGPWPDYPVQDVDATRQQLTETMKAAQQWLRQRPLRVLAEKLTPEHGYMIEEIWALYELPAADLTGRLAIALLLNAHNEVIDRDVSQVSGRATYRLRSGEDIAAAIEASDPRPDQMAILATIERHIGTPPDLYKRSVNPETGAVTLAFHFPAIAREQYAAPLAAAAQEAGVSIELSPHAHQGMLSQAATALLPAGLTVLKTSLHHERQTIVLKVGDNIDPAATAQAQAQFHAQTGWHLAVDTPDGSSTPATSAAPAPAAIKPEAGQTMLDVNRAMALVRQTFDAASGFHKVSADQQRSLLTVRFHFPDVAREQYADTLADLAAQTGWQVAVYPEPHQGAMDELARRVLPAGLTAVGAPSLYRGEQRAALRCRGAATVEEIAAAEQAFAEASGWALNIRVE